MPFLNAFHNIHRIFAEKSMEKIFCLKSTELSTVIVVTFLKMYRYRYRRYFFSEVSVPISSLLLKYRVPTSGRQSVAKVTIHNSAMTSL